METKRQLQELFDTVATHLLQQGVACIVDGTPFYKGNNGMSCAIGYLITPENYHKRLEGQGVVDEGVYEAVEASLGRKISEEELQLLYELQDTHDTCDPSKWPKLLRIIADEFHLKPN